MVRSPREMISGLPTGLPTGPPPLMRWTVVLLCGGGVTLLCFRFVLVRLEVTGLGGDMLCGYLSSRLLVGGGVAGPGA
jgi:hypothetical protein